MCIVSISYLLWYAGDPIYPRYLPRDVILTRRKEGSDIPRAVWSGLVQKNPVFGFSYVTFLWLSCVGYLFYQVKSSEKLKFGSIKKSELKKLDPSSVFYLKGPDFRPSPRTSDVIVVTSGCHLADAGFDLLSIRVKTPLSLHPHGGVTVTRTHSITQCHTPCNLAKLLLNTPHIS